MLFSTVSISKGKYCLNIFTLPGSWAMLENKLHIWSLLRDVVDRGHVTIESEHRSLTKQTTNKRGGGGQEAVGDSWLFCTSVHSQKRENHVYWDLILNKKKKSISTRNFARITKKKNLMKRLNKKRFA